VRHGAPLWSVNGSPEALTALVKPSGALLIAGEFPLMGRELRVMKFGRTGTKTHTVSLEGFTRAHTGIR